MEFCEISEILRRSGATAGGVKRRLGSSAAANGAINGTATGDVKILKFTRGLAAR